MARLVNNPLLGSDPEVFIYASHMGVIYPVLDLLGGTKEEPRPMAKEGFFVQEDNVLAEFNIPPSSSRKEFVENIETGLQLLEKELPSGFIPVVQQSHRFKEQQLLDPRAMAFGCNPDFNAWKWNDETMEAEQNDAPAIYEDPFLRSAGGHVVLGYDNPTKALNNRIVRLCDAYLGVPSILLDRDTDRRKLYGKAGAYRDKPYGVEYRTLSSFWIGNKAYTGWVWDQMMKIVDHINNDEDDIIIDHDAFIIDTINSANVKNAKRFVERYKIEVPAL